jgi:hypothetical protein
LLLGIASATFLVSETSGTHEHYLPAFHREIDRDRNLGVVVRYTALGGGRETNVFGLESYQAMTAGLSCRGKEHDQNELKM